jgi:hypothetical protein
MRRFVLETGSRATPYRVLANNGISARLDRQVDADSGGKI